MIEGLNLQEDVIVFDMYTPNQRAARETDESTKTTGDFNSLHQKWTAPAGRQPAGYDRRLQTTSIQPQQDTPASQAYVEYSPRPTSGTWNIP